MLSRLRNIAVLCLALLVLLVGVTWQQLQWYMDKPMAIDAAGFEYTLARGDTLSTMTGELQRRGVLPDSLWHKLYCRNSGRGQHIHAGDYWLPAGLTPRQLLDKLESGDVRFFQLTLVEGWTLRQVAAYLQQQEKLSHVLAGSITAESLDVDWDKSLEGMLFPDTYRYQRGDTDRMVLRRAYQRMQAVLDQEWQQRQPDLPYTTPYEALIMASLVEKETGFAPERPIIAGVFVRRLQKNMRLQTDPTVIYGLGDSFDGNLRSRHLRDTSNRYNTYRHKGLPPSPIALAGREAIHAALHPATGSALYFVAKGDGSHYFSDTLEQHQRAVRQYQIEQRKKNYSSSPPPDSYLRRDEKSSTNTL